MKVKGKLVFKGENAGELISTIARSLEPDNPSEIETLIDGNSATVIFTAEKIGTLLSSVDDYLMNAKVADDVIKSTKKREPQL
ncbi:MAG: KEOPS complex subunit Pcc1 [Candidatus Methanoperedens sp.]|nr:KEOPS complex subunit Pcc1 [Candidatus Methanoperedens sp.]